MSEIVPGHWIRQQKDHERKGLSSLLAQKLIGRHYYENRSIRAPNSNGSKPYQSFGRTVDEKDELFGRLLLNPLHRVQLGHIS